MSSCGERSTTRGLCTQNTSPRSEQTGMECRQEAVCVHLMAMTPREKANLKSLWTMGLHPHNVLEMATLARGSTD